MKQLRILLADDHTLVRAGIRSLLDQMPNVAVVAEAADGRQALKLALAQAPDVAILDIAMPGLNGLETAVRLRKQCPGVHVIILSMHANEDYILRAFQSGATGYLLKKSAVAELKAALDAVRAGSRYLSSTLARRVSLPEVGKPRRRYAPLDQLTARQREILQLLAESRTAKEIAAELRLSPKTVEFHRAQLMKRLGIYDVPALVRYALKSGLVETEE